MTESALRAAPDALSVVVEGVSKVYQMWNSPLGNVVGLVAPRLCRPSREFRALDGVSASIARGETVGIVGHNGSGKSTLLQVISGILTPTEGTVRTEGTISALLELGSGFNPEFTGRENAYLYGMILGLGVEAMDARMDTIIAFSELGEVVDQPVKQYSSGMVMRLAFSVAVSVDPEILIIDEALAVGDAPFQVKCFDKIREIRERGTTIIVVSHSTQIMVELCDRCLLLDHGRLLATGAPKWICSVYLKLMFAPESEKARIRREIETGVAEGDRGEKRDDADAAGAQDDEVEYASRGARIDNVRLLDADGMLIGALIRGETYVVAYEVRFDIDVAMVRFATLLKTLRGVELGGLGFGEETADTRSFRAGETVAVRFRFRCALVPGVYTLNAGVNALVDGERHSLHRRMNATVFEVIAMDGREITGLVDFGLQPSIERLVRETVG
ncbi:MAG: ABC transporter ATP-binding protein [Alphaproteobacteria bacterium]|nr:ABC transporter ATP-binding protein [Alphaproteobacteria bacterium]